MAATAADPPGSSDRKVGPPMRPLIRTVSAVLASAAVVVSGALLAAPASAASAGLVIGEVYGGGGNSGATLTNDFIELQNRGSVPVSVDGWSVQYHPSSASGSWQTTPLSGTVPPGGYYLVQEGAGQGGSAALPTPDATGGIALSATAGTVALVSSTSALTCTASDTCASAAVDLVGYGSAAIREGSPATGASNTASVQRVAGPDTDANSADFTAAAPTPKAQNTGPTGPPVDPTPGAVRIRDIQGTAFLSPLAGQRVERVPGVVTAVRPTGYFLQDPTPDADPATSEGVFVYTGSTPAVAVGDSVLVSGRVTDYNPGGNPSNPTVSTLALTEIGSATTSILARGVALPAPVVLTPTTVPESYAPDLGGANIETGAIQRSRSALDFYESIEGMRVEVDDARVVGPSNQYGDQFVTTKPEQNRSSRGATVLEADNATPSGRLKIVPADGAKLGLRVGDVLAGPNVGPLDYSQFGGYTVVATTLGTIVRSGLQRSTADRQDADQLAVATYNVNNLTPTSPPEKFAALASGIVANLASPDVVALEEVQDNTGATDDGTVAADQTLTTLTRAIADAGGPRYQWRQIDPVNDQDGGEPGGNIRIAFLFNPERVSFVDRGDPSVDRSTTATAVTRVSGSAQLTLSPGRIAPTSDAWTSSRKPLVGEFRFRGRPVFVVGNHWNSKGGDQSADGRYQYPAQSSRIQRQKQATEVRGFVDALLKADARAKVVIAGDFNDFPFSPPVQTLTAGGALTDLIATLPKEERYTYIYNGVAQVLDDILVSKGAGRVEYQVVRLNAEFEDQVSDHDPQVVRLRVASAVPTLPVCRPSALALGYSDRLDTVQRDGVTLGGLSSLAYDRRAGAYVSTAEGRDAEPARLWFVTNPWSPEVARDPLVLKRPDGTPYTGQTADDEGVAVLPNGDYLVSSETEPSIRVFGRDGVQTGELPVPGRFAVTGTTLPGSAVPGEATSDATLEGLTISPSGRTVVAAMEGALSGDVSATGDATAHRFLVYGQDRRGAWTLSKQLAYRADAGQRIAEVAAYGDDSLLVEEASSSPVTGDAVKLYAVTDVDRAADVSTVGNLSAAPASAFPAKKLVADLGTCPTLGATAKRFQANPLLENYEGMAVTVGLFGAYSVSLISDDDVSATRTTRVLNLGVRLP